MKLNTKGQSVLDNFGSLAIGVGTFTIIIIVAFLIMSQGKTAAINQITATSYDRERTTIEDSATTCFEKCIHDENMVVTAITQNASGEGLTWSAENYSISKNCITMATSPYDYNNTANISYSCKKTSVAYNSTETLQSATDTVPGWISIIIITAIGAAILGMVGLLKRNQ